MKWLPWSLLNIKVMKERRWGWLLETTRDSWLCSWLGLGKYTHSAIKDIWGIIGQVWISNYCLTFLGVPVVLWLTECLCLQEMHAEIFRGERRVIPVTLWNGSTIKGREICQNVNSWWINMIDLYYSFIFFHELVIFSELKWWENKYT